MLWLERIDSVGCCREQLAFDFDSVEPSYPLLHCMLMPVMDKVEAVLGLDRDCCILAELVVAVDIGSSALHMPIVPRIVPEPVPEQLEPLVAYLMLPLVAVAVHQVQVICCLGT